MVKYVSIIVIETRPKFKMSVPKSIGFIGLGVMGLRMVERLTKLTERDVVIYVFDVNTEVTRVLAEQHPGRVVVQQNSREVAASSVSCF